MGLQNLQQGILVRERTHPKIIVRDDVPSQSAEGEMPDHAGTVLTEIDAMIIHLGSFDPVLIKDFDNLLG